MNIFKLFQSRRGAISKVGLLGVAATVLVTGVTLSDYFVDSPAKQEQAIRDLSSIIYSGNPLPEPYSGIQLSMGKYAGQFASEEQRAAKQRDEFGLAASDAADALENGTVGLEGKISRRNLGATEGLGMGGNDAQELINQAAGKVADVSVDGAGIKAAAERSRQGKRAGQEQQTKINSLANAKSGLERAAMARSNGTEYGSGVTGGFGGSQSGSGQTAVGPNSISSGRMEGTSSLVRASRSLKEQYKGNLETSRDAKFQGGYRTNSELASLKQIAKDSAKIAASSNKSANAGAQPFMASFKNAGGLSESDTFAEEETGDTSYQDPLDEQERNLNQGLQDLDTHEQERKAAQDNLFSFMLAAIPTVIGLAIGIQQLRKVKPQNFWTIAGIAALAAIAAVLIGRLLYKSIHFGRTYGSWGMPIFGIAESGLLAGVVAFALLSNLQHKVWQRIEKVIDFLGKNMGISIFVGAAWSSMGGPVQIFQNWKNVETSEDKSNLKNG